MVTSLPSLSQAAFVAQREDVERLLLTNKAHEQAGDGAHTQRRDGWRAGESDVRTWKSILRKAAKQMDQPVADTK